ncbi:unnamed protein product, partial [Lampetra planeri]
RAWLVDESNIVRSRAANSFGSPNGMEFALRARMHNRVARDHAGRWPPATIATAATTASRLCHSTLATEGTHVPGFARRQPGDWSHFPGAPPAAAAWASTHAATCQASRLAERQGARLKSRELKAAVQVAPHRMLRVYFLCGSKLPVLEPQRAERPSHQRVQALPLSDKRRAPRHGHGATWSLSRSHSGAT